MEQTYAIGSIWLLLAVLASLISIRLGISVALIEIAVGVVGGNLIHLEITPWVNFLAGFGAVLLTFLAGAEINPQSLRESLKESISIGFLSFLLPFLVGMGVAFYGLHWDINAAKIAGIALSTTSVAVVFAVMVETGLSSTKLGQSILAACFITDLGTVIALGLLFTGFTYKLLIFVVILGIAIFIVPKMTLFIFKKYGERVSEPEIKFLFLVLIFLAYVALTCGSEAVLPAYILGMALAGLFEGYKNTLHKMRAIVFTVFTPFYFIKAGSLVSLPILSTMAGAVLLLLAAKIGAKFIGVLPATKYFRYENRIGIYTTLLMSTGLTFGSISALYGLTNNYIDQAQYSVLITVVILSAIVPTFIAQKWFFPYHLAISEKSSSKKINGKEEGQ